MSNPGSGKAHQNQHFQLERIVLFSDAVFAIAITLLVIEIKIPHFDKMVSQAEFANALLEKTGDFLGFVISFAVIAQFWVSHHTMFGYLKSHSPGLIWLNFLTLLWIAFMPFSTYLNMQFGYLDLTWIWYSSNMALISFSMYLIWRYVGKHPQLSDMATDKLFMKYRCRGSLYTSLIFFFGGLMTLIPSDTVKWSSRFIFIIIFPMFSMLRKQYDKARASTVIQH